MSDAQVSAAFVNTITAAAAAFLLFEEEEEPKPKRWRKRPCGLTEGGGPSPWPMTKCVGWIMPRLIISSE